jgi:O-antigen/teichoic acid export membrane protein
VRDPAFVAAPAGRQPLPRLGSLLGGGLLRGSALLLASATLVNLGNYLFNLVLGRWLGPAAFADLSLIITLFLVASFLTAGLMTPAARFTALHTADGNLQAIANTRRWLGRAGLVIGMLLALFLIAGAPTWSRFFSTESALPFAIFGLFLPFYLLQGVDRGILQGRTRFAWLAVTYQGEMWSRLLLSLAFVALGWDINGAVLGIGLSFVVAWLVARPARRDLPSAVALTAAEARPILVFAGPVLVAQLGQILINNSDILIVRHFFPAETAGQYAALALIGRIVFFATWSIVTVMFPVVAQRFRRGEAHRHLLGLALGVVLAGSLVIITLTYFFPELIIGILFGPAYLSIAPLLWVYSLATMLYALSNVIINYRLSLGTAGGTYLAIAAGVTQVAVLWLVHASLEQVVWVQVVLMGALFSALALWDLWLSRRPQAVPRPV